MVIQAYLNFNGNCKEAVEFYAQVFDSTPKMMTFGDMPESPDYPLTEDMKKLVMHANLDICGNQIMFSDVLPGHPFIPGNNINIALSSNDTAQLTAWFDKLAQGGQVVMPVGETFFSKLYGFVIDQFGIGWQVNYAE